MKIEIAKDFSTTPGGRFKGMGPDSGEAFRERLIKLLRSHPHEIIEIYLDGTETYGSSFLDEAFGGLVRAKIFPPQEILHRVKIVAKDPLFQIYAREALDYMREAVNEI